MFPQIESLIVVVVFPTVGVLFAIAIAKEMWDISGWTTLGIGIGGWLIGFVLGALGSTLVHEIFDKSNHDDSL